ncbi:MAG: hypothetical protein J5J00_08490 [Deltaproteobacteria bacterium]|nr:hypothetical protein [Deltaproteobacteria bacterium]
MAVTPGQHQQQSKEAAGPGSQQRPFSHLGEEAINGADPLAVLQAALGYQFDDKRLLTQALTHKVWDQAYNYELLEFIGDRVLALVAAEFAVGSASQDCNASTIRGITEELTRNKFFAERARELQLDALMIAVYESARTKIPLSQVESVIGSFKVLADVYEAVFGAIFIDGGFECAFNSARGSIAPFATPAIDPQKFAGLPDGMLKASFIKDFESIFDYRVSAPELLLPLSYFVSTGRFGKMGLFSQFKAAGDAVIELCIVDKLYWEVTGDRLATFDNLKNEYLGNLRHSQKLLEGYKEARSAICYLYRDRKVAHRFLSAAVGIVYIDGGYEAASKVVDKFISPTPAGQPSSAADQSVQKEQNYKFELETELQGYKHGKVLYETKSIPRDERPDLHICKLRVSGKVAGSALSESSAAEAEQLAAKEALKTLHSGKLGLQPR